MSLSSFKNKRIGSAGKVNFFVQLFNGLTQLGTPVLIGTSATNPSNNIFTLSESMQNFKYLIVVLVWNGTEILASTHVPLDILATSSSYVSIYVTSSWRMTVKFNKVSDTQINASVDERAGFSGVLKVYGVR